MFGHCGLTHHRNVHRKAEFRMHDRHEMHKTCGERTMADEKPRNPDDLLTPKQVEEQYGFSANTLSTWRAKRYGPKFCQPGGIGGKVMYRRRHMDEFIDSWTVETRVS